MGRLKTFMKMRYDALWPLSAENELLVQLVCVWTGAHDQSSIADMTCGQSMHFTHPECYESSCTVSSSVLSFPPLANYVGRFDIRGPWATFTRSCTTSCGNPLRCEEAYRPSFAGGRAGKAKPVRECMHGKHGEFDCHHRAFTASPSRTRRRKPAKCNFRSEAHPEGYAYLC